MYIMIALTIFAEYPKETRLSYVKRYYDAISKHKINIPTPIMRQECELHFDNLLHCVLVDVDDTLDSIFASDMAIGKYVAKGAASVSTQAESVASTVKYEGRRSSTHRCHPFLKKFESTVRCCTQNGIRGGSADCPLPNLAPRNRRHHRSEE